MKSLIYLFLFFIVAITSCQESKKTENIIDAEITQETLDCQRFKERKIQVAAYLDMVKDFSYKELTKKSLKFSKYYDDYKIYFPYDSLNSKEVLVINKGDHIIYFNTDKKMEVYKKIQIDECLDSAAFFENIGDLELRY